MSQLAMQLGSSAVFSTCRTYRYVLRRSWGDAPSIVFIMLNPSTADETQDDPTIRRCIGYAQKWGYGGLIVTNIFALRSTNPKALYSHSDPIGPENNQWLCSLSSEHDTICAWGAHGTFKDRGNQIIKMLTEHRGPMMALRITKDGHPAHPLYLPGNLQPFEFANPESGRRANAIICEE